MDRIIEVKVNGGYLSKDSRKAGNQYEANITKLRITFDPSWDGYAKTVLFRDALGQNPVKRILTADLLEDMAVSTRVYLCPIPGEAMTESGMMSFSITGYLDGVRQYALKAELEVEEGDLEEGGDPADPTPSQAEQLQGQIEAILGNIQEGITDAAKQVELAASHAASAEQAALAAKTSEEAAAGQAEAAQQAAEEAGTAATGANAFALNAAEQARIAESHAKAAEDWAEAAKGFATGAANAANAAIDAAGQAATSAQEAADWSNALEPRVEALEEQMEDLESGGDLAPRVETLESKVADLLYEPIALVAKSIDPATVENGQSVGTATLSWALNKEPARIRLDGEEITPTKTGTVTVEVGGYTGWSLIFWDERDTSVNWMPAIAFRNGIYYGTAAAPEIIDSAFVLGLEKKVLSNAKGRTITVNAEDGEYIWYCLPASISKADSCVFKVGGFEGGFDLVDTTAITNSYGYTEDYYIYRSVRAGLGETTVEVS